MTPIGYLVYGEFIPADMVAANAPFAAPVDALISPLYTHGEYDVVIPGSLVRRMDLADGPGLHVWIDSDLRWWVNVYTAGEDVAAGAGRTLQEAIDVAAGTMGDG